MRTLNILFMAAALLIAAHVPSAAQELTIAEIEQKANQGDLESMYLMGRAYYRGLGGVTKNEELGRKWYKAAFEKAKEEGNRGNKKAVGMVVLFYQKNYGGVVERDSVEAMKWYQKGIDMDILPIQLREVRRYIHYQQWKEAVSMTKRVLANADNSKHEGAGYMGDFYYYGRGGLKRNYAQAVHYYKMQLDGDTYDSKTEAINGLGKCYFYGHGVKKSTPQAIKCWQKMSKSNLDDEAAYLYASCLIKGTGIAKNVDEGVEMLKWLERLSRVPDDIKQKAAKLRADTEGEIARQEFLAEQKRREQEERRRQEEERKNLLYEGVYTSTGKSINYTDGSFTDSGVAGLEQVKICKNRIIVNGTVQPLTSTDGDWLCYGSYEGCPIYLYNTKTGELRWRFVFVFFGKHISDYLWYRGNHVAEHTAPLPSPGTSTRPTTTTTTTTGTTRRSHRCNLCDGRGWIPTDDGVPTFGNTSKKWCKECNTSVYMSHWHKSCPSCGGKGSW